MITAGQYWYDDREYLLPYFNEMLDQSGSNEDWKRRFTAIISEDRFEVYNTAAIFFTGAPLVEVKFLPHIGDIIVSCKGYYEAIDAPDFDDALTALRRRTAHAIKGKITLDNAL